jgi:hypothetical protein
LLTFDKKNIKAFSNQNVAKMGCPALGVSAAFFKQPALPGEAPKTKQNSKKTLKNKNQ